MSYPFKHKQDFNLQQNDIWRTWNLSEKKW